MYRLTLASWALVAIASWACGNGTTVPVISVEAGGEYELGFKVGNETKHSLRRFFADEKSSPNVMLRPYYRTNEGRDFIHKLLANSKASFPDYIKYLRGIAEASGIDFIDLFLLNCDTEILLQIRKHNGDHCSDVLSVSGKHRFIGHNEDYEPDVIGHVFMMNATITRPERRTVYAFMYPGTLAGYAFSFNSYGVGITANAVFPKHVETKGAVPVVFICSYMLKAKSIKHGLEILRGLYKKNIVASSGISLNIGSVTEDYMVNVEISSSTIEVVKISTHENPYAFHFNQYSHTNVSEFKDPSSDHRNLTSKALLRENRDLPFTEEGIKEILSDATDTDYPIYRNISKADKIITLASGIFDFKQKTFSLYDDQPSRAKPTLVVSLEPTASIETGLPILSEII
mmetsp:Transcript_9869/g.16160  ORF Transcript_9869/g.16160 Transcript_9869/m.16160 type:complete len:401 (+) Transcript_9869:2252-3454(+)